MRWSNKSGRFGRTGLCQLKATQPKCPDLFDHCVTYIAKEINPFALLLLLIPNSNPDPDPNPYSDLEPHSDLNPDCDCVLDPGPNPNLDICSDPNPPGA